jgi:hypothetical protein
MTGRTDSPQLWRGAWLSRSHRLPSSVLLLPTDSGPGYIRTRAVALWPSSVIPVLVPRTSDTKGRPVRETYEIGIVGAGLQWTPGHAGREMSGEMERRFRADIRVLKRDQLMTDARRGLP